MQRTKWCLKCLTIFVAIQIFLFAKVSAQDPGVEVVPVAHSHNDYLRDQPLTDALDNGFASVEVDIFNRKDAFPVAHTWLGIRKGKNLQTLYLEPLRHHVKGNNGYVYPGWDGEFVLMLDLKGNWDSDGLRQLENELLNYPDLFRVFYGDSVSQRPVRVLLSGGYSLHWFAEDSTRIFSADARISNMDVQLDSAVVPRVSSNFKTYFSWRGKGEMPEAEKELLLRLVDSAHTHNRKLRFWGAPDKEPVWRQLLDAGADWINTDQPIEFSLFYRQYVDEQENR